MPKRRVLVAPLNWGLGHATRCIPLIRKLKAYDYEALIASDGQAQLLLKKEFPELQHFSLPSYNITYSSKKSLFKWALLKQTPHILKTIKQEYDFIQHLVQEEKPDGIISDNRYGVRSGKVPSVFVTHQINVKSGSTSFLSSKLQQRLISRFDQCWIPDSPGSFNLSGELGHPRRQKVNMRYIGPLSRFEKRDTRSTFDLMILLSGPEPQRTLLEHKLLDQLKNNFSKKVLFVRGVVKDSPPIQKSPHVVVYNYLNGKELETALNSSQIILARPGYTTIMDLAKLSKKVFFIPTPGQPEQEYLALRMSNLDIAPMSSQENFDLSQVDLAESYEGLRLPIFPIDFGELFSLFNGE